MSSVNKAILIGRLGGDPELRTTPAGAQVVNFNIATNERWKDKSGKQNERTEWHNIVVWGPQAAACAQFLKKGSTVFIEGRLQTRKWTDKTGADRYTTEVQAAEVRFLDQRSASSSGEPSAAKEPVVPPTFPVGEDDLPW